MVTRSVISAGQKDQADCQGHLERTKRKWCDPIKAQATPQCALKQSEWMLAKKDPLCFTHSTSKAIKPLHLNKGEDLFCCAMHHAKRRQKPKS